MSIKIKILIGIGLVVAGAAAFSFLGDSDKLTGRLDKQIAFFQDAPIKDKVIEGSFVTYAQAAELFTNASVKKGRITKSQATQFVSYYASGASASRQDIAAMAVLIFKLEGTGSVKNIIDLPANPSYQKAILTCIENGCIEMTSNLFKPTNMATKEFVNKVANNLSKSEKVQ